MAAPNEIVDQLAGSVLFSDLARPQLEEVAHSIEEQWFSEGQRVLRQGFTGSGLYFIIEGEVAVEIGGYGVVLQNPNADVMATGQLRVLVLPEPDAEAFLKAHPSVMYRMMQAQARRLRSANLFRG